MKSTILIFFTFGILMPFGHSQTKNDLKGPKSKNHKPWLDKSAGSQAVFTLAHINDQPMGPQAKNALPRLNAERKSELVTANASKSRLTGPSYKNHQAWMQKKDHSGEQIAGEDMTSSHPANHYKRK